MSRKSVAVLDIRSSEIAVFVGERGVNNTFVFKASKTEPYYGYESGAFYDEADLSEAVYKAVSAVEQICGERIRELYIGVPGEFTDVVPKEQNIGFPKKRKISQKEIDALFESGAEKREGYRVLLLQRILHRRDGEGLRQDAHLPPLFAHRVCDGELPHSLGNAG